MTRTVRALKRECAYAQKEYKKLESGWTLDGLEVDKEKGLHDPMVGFGLEEGDDKDLEDWEITTRINAHLPLQPPYANIDTAAPPASAATAPTPSLLTPTAPTLVDAPLRSIPGVKLDGINPYHEFRNPLNQEGQSVAEHQDQTLALAVAGMVIGAGSARCEDKMEGVISKNEGEVGKEIEDKGDIQTSPPDYSVFPELTGQFSGERVQH